MEPVAGYAIKIVNPGGVENWKWGKNVAELDDEVIGYGVTPRQIVQTLATIADDLGLPHAVHIHGINLGRHTSARTTMEMIAALDGHRAHLCHLQFLSYGAGRGHVHSSEAVAVAAAVNASSRLTVDVGQVIFGQATTMTCDGPLQYGLHRTTGHKWINDDVEGESGGGIVPITYNPATPSTATMWLTGMEASPADRRPVAGLPEHRSSQRRTLHELPSGHPAAHGSRLPQGDVRESAPAGAERSLLPELDREYSLGEIAVITRAGPARALGLEHKGHLGVGADGDIAVYEECADKEAMFARPRYVYKGGELVAARRRRRRRRERTHVLGGAAVRRGIEAELREYFKKAYTVSFDNYSVLSGHGAPTEIVACG